MFVRRFRRKNLAARLSRLFAGLGLLALACSQSPSGDPNGPGGSGKKDAIDPIDDPAGLLRNPSRALADLISAADIGQTFGTTDTDVPYPDTYWPFVDEGIDAEWHPISSPGSDAGTGRDPSPLAKYMKIFDPFHYSQAKQWEHDNHGNGVPGVASWYGHCPGWTGAAMFNAPIQHAVTVRSDGSGGIVPCAAGESDCSTFEIGDINALEAETYLDGASSFIGSRCDTKPSAIQRDRFGRIARDGTGCKGINPGSLLIIMANIMKKQQKPFAIDAQNDFNTDQIWNQPAYRYHVYDFQTLTASEAANMVENGTRSSDPTLTAYPFNDAAKGFALVDFGLRWVREHGPNTVVFSGANSTHETRMVAVIELDGDPAAAGTQVIGGEYLTKVKVGADQLTVPPFLWTIKGPGPEVETGHNPYVKTSLVEKLIAAGQQ